ncbi:MAG: efflux RND transporter periplasmic adaptor subunit [bacterium]|nr:efflux RND transporter periplasmic adaptor subunit [bacterium]
MRTESRIAGVLAGLGWLVAGFLLAVMLLVDPLGLHPLNERLSGTEPAHEEHAEDAGLWTCGMHPHVIQEEPGQCPICHMDLVPMRISEEPEAAPRVWTCPKHSMIEESEPGVCPIGGRELVPREGPPGGAEEGSVGVEGDGTAIRIDPAVIQNMNVRTELVERRDLEHKVRTVGTLEYDQQRMVTVATKYSGWVGKVYVNYIGEPVKKGQPLFEIYSPELVQTEQELISAIGFARRMQSAPEESRRHAEALVEAARARLSYWDISDDQIAELERGGEVFRTLTVTSPASGVVMKRMPGLEGMAIQPGTQTFHIADLSSLWLSVEVFEDQLAWIREGTPAKVTFTYFPGQTFRGTVRFLEPELSEATRTLQVKLEVPNRDGRLRAGMFATVVFAPVALEDALTVPSLAVLRTGERDVVVVALGEGRFLPKEVVLGLERGGFVEVLEGLEEGERVVTSAQFLLDSESSLQEAVQKMIAQAGGGHAGH